MSAVILDGRKLASQMKSALTQEVEALREKYQLSPCMVSIIVGNDPAALSYAASQERSAKAIGIKYQLTQLPADASAHEIISLIEACNQQDHIHGILLNKPLGAHLDFIKISSAIDVHKDVEGLNVVNLGLLMMGKNAMLPCTPAASVALLKTSGIDLAGKEVVVVGRSEIVGKPIALMLLKENATVTVCHSFSSKAGTLSDHLKRADIIIAAMGKPHFITGEHIKQGACIIDVGINEVNGAIVGDVEFNSCQLKAGFISPVPGGVGPVTAMILMQNLLESYKRKVCLHS